MRKIREILRLRHELGFKHRAIARAVHVGSATVSEYLAKAASKGLGWPLPKELSDAELERVLYPRASESPERELPDFAAMHGQGGFASFSIVRSLRRDHRAAINFVASKPVRYFYNPTERR